MNIKVNVKYKREEKIRIFDNELWSISENDRVLNEMCAISRSCDLCVYRTNIQE